MTAACMQTHINLVTASRVMNHVQYWYKDRYHCACDRSHTMVA